jgi:hypothetical protein
MNNDIDRLDWLRKIRQKIVLKCGNDPKEMGNYFRKIQKQYENRVISEPLIPLISPDYPEKNQRNHNNQLNQRFKAITREYQ